MTKEKYEELQKKAVEDVKMPEDMNALMQKNDIMATLIQEWIVISSRQAYNLMMIDERITQLKGKLVKFYKYEDNYKWNTLAECESQAAYNPQYVKYRKIYLREKSYLKFFEDTLANLKGMPYAIKNQIEWKKYGMGIT
jgi:hypothetical protein